MKTLTPDNATTVRQIPEMKPPIRVCMHVLRAARSDVRAMRAATTLVEAGFSVSIIDVDSAQTPTAGEHMQGLRIEHVTVPRSFSSTRFERWPIVKAALLFARSIVNVLREPAAIYHACEVTALPACYLAARLRHKPLIFEAYELPLCDRPLAEMSRSRRWLHALLALFLAHVIPRCVAVITVSPPIVEEMQKRYHTARVALLRNLPTYRAVSQGDRLRQRLALSPGTRIALYQGYLQPDRGLDRLVRAAPFLEPGVVIVMMGQGIGTTQRDLESLIAAEKVADRVKIIPPVPYAELLDWTASADIGLTIIPLDYTLNMRMALPNKLFEYLMAGLPVLTSPLEAVSEVINFYDTGHVVPSLEPAAVGTAINEMLKDDAALARMRRNALDAAQKALCWEQESPKLVCLYQEVLGEPRRQA